MPFCTAPTLFDRVQLRVELGQEQDCETALCTVVFKNGFDTLEIRLSIKEPPDAAAGLSSRATKAWAFSFEIPEFLIQESSLL
jgi:hypothetical protein